MRQIGNETHQSFGTEEHSQQPGDLQDTAVLPSSQGGSLEPGIFPRTLKMGVHHPSTSLPRIITPELLACLPFRSQFLPFPTPPCLVQLLAASPTSQQRRGRLFGVFSLLTSDGDHLCGGAEGGVGKPKSSDSTRFMFGFGALF